MADRDLTAESDLAPPQEEGGDRFDALLEERFSPAGRREMAGQIASHDQKRAPEGFDLEQKALAHVPRGPKGRASPAVSGRA